MNTLMYEHPLTAEHIRVVKDILRYEVVGPIGKALACGDIGMFVALVLASTDSSSRHGGHDRMEGYSQFSGREVPVEAET